MNKDVIYIDVEDDITAIIGKVKASKEKVVALVPPKRVGVLQSAVNLQLLGRAAKQGDKHLALVTNNHALIALASAASIPVAKNLQTKPELAEVPALQVDDDDDIIDGASLPIGEHASQTKTPGEKTQERSVVMAAALAEAPKSGEELSKPKIKSGSRVPNFNRFRKRLIVAILAAILLIVFLVWALVFAPRATIVISAKTTSTSVNEPVSVSSKAATNLDNGTIHAILNDQSDDKSVDFEATGKKDAGKKAIGDVSFSNNTLAEKTVSAGTKLTSSGGLVFIVDSTVTVPAGAVSCPTISSCSGSPGTASGTVTAAENGSKYNAADGGLSGASSGVSASFSQPTSGGVTKMVTVVSAGDVQKAKKSLVDEDTDAAKNELKAKFSGTDVVLEDSFNVDYGDVESTPAIGDEASTAKLTTKLTYQLYGVSRDELNNFLDAYMENQLKDHSDQQRVYNNGADKAVLQEVTKTSNGAKGTLIATAQVGPTIKDEDVKAQSKGKRYGEIQQTLESIPGVDTVDVKFFPFWVSAVPNDDSRITVEFKLNESQ